ncbi:MipA/OmpV family protein [Azospirillum oleiclasticum]|nr:MipA/OmpV family protein [Azospirillum oleiclasticum]
MALTMATMTAGTAASAHADPVPGEPSSDRLDVGADVSEQKGQNRWIFGAGVAMAPRYQGSDRYEAQPLPLIDVRVGRFFAKVGDGIGVTVIETPTFTAGVSVNWLQGYDADDVPDGVQGVDSALGARVFVSARLKGFVATLAATQAVTDTDRGLLINAGVAYPIRATERLTITPSLGATWGSRTYMDGYFGIDTSEATASGLPRYRPSSGLKDLSFRVAANYRITDSISLAASIGVTQLLDRAADSPIVEKKTQPIGLVGLTYSF